MRRHPITALDVLHYVTVGEKVQRFINESAPKLMDSWRKIYPGKDDDYILRDMLTKCGWKYQRHQERWVHPELEAMGKAYEAPDSLEKLARMIATTIAEKTLNGV